MAGNVAAIVLAAGLSKRMGGFKPLLPLGGMTAVERCVNLFRAAGITDVRVVTGYRGDELKPLLERLNVLMVDNPRYREGGMFSSVAAGLATIESEIDSFFVLPVDIPLVRPSTIRRLLDARREKGCDVLHPVFRGLRGHPPLIAGGHSREIANWEGDGGLKQVLALWEPAVLEVCVADGNILLDMDSADDYRSMREKADRLGVPTVEECGELLEKVFCVGDGIIRHGRAVARVAVCLGEELNRVGNHLDIPLIEASCLLHDIAKGEPDHAWLGARRLYEEGFAAVAGPVASHMEITITDNDTVSDAQVVYLADKMVSRERPVPLEERFRARMERHMNEPDILERVKSRLQAAQKIKERIESKLGRSLEEVLTQ
ncbi:MAG TPA: NTP transferase domain-containing protein [Geobacteraceae bacterium]|nr:NTP transferase domain-containing protein [Geobacteraceae bacterium]